MPRQKRTPKVDKGVPKLQLVQTYYKKVRDIDLRNEN